MARRSARVVRANPRATEARDNPAMDDIVIVGGIIVAGVLLIRHYKPDPGKGVGEFVQAFNDGINHDLALVGESIGGFFGGLGNTIHPGAAAPPGWQGNDNGQVSSSPADVGYW